MLTSMDRLLGVFIRGLWGQIFLCFWMLGFQFHFLALSNFLQLLFHFSPENVPEHIINMFPLKFDKLLIFDNICIEENLFNNEDVVSIHIVFYHFDQFGSQNVQILLLFLCGWVLLIWNLYVVSLVHDLEFLLQTFC